MTSFQEQQAQVAEEIQNLTTQCIDKLTEIWTDTFEIEICEDNLKKLTEHVSIFYKEVVAESLHRQNFIKVHIQKLHEEAINLRRLLKVDIAVSPQKGVPLYTAQMKLDCDLRELRERLKKRKDQIYELLLEQETLCDELGEQPRELLDDPLPTEEQLQDFRLHLDILKQEKNNRLHEISTLRRDIKNFLAELELEIQNEEENNLLNACHIALTKTNVSRLKELHQEYSKQIEEVRESIETMKKKLKNLWDCLDVSPSVREKFAKYTDYSQTTYDKFYRELDRCETQKRQNIKKFVDKLRDEIVVWWERTLKSNLEKSRFSNFTNDCYTEDLLTLHEMELEDLKRFYHENEKIFNLIFERRILWDRMTALEAKASEPGRYNNRGGQLLKEEKERKTIANKLPKIEAQLTELVREYEAQHNRKFLVYGEDVLEIIARDWEKKKAEKEKLMSARKNGATPLSKTISRTPLSLKNHVISSSMKKLPSSNNMSSLPSSNKRKLPQTDFLHPSAKRSLLAELTTPNKFLKPKPANRTPFKSPGKRNRVIATTIKRKSGRSSGNSRNRRKSRTPKKMHKAFAPSENSITSESMTYDVFEEYIEKDPATRSSILTDGHNKVRTRNQYRAATNLQLPNPRLLRTPSKLNVLDQHSVRKSPGLSRTGSPMAGPNSRKLTTKNLPIII